MRRRSFPAIRNVSRRSRRSNESQGIGVFRDRDASQHSYASHAACLVLPPPPKPTFSLLFTIEAAVSAETEEKHETIQYKTRQDIKWNGKLEGDCLTLSCVYGPGRYVCVARGLLRACVR